MEAAQAAGGGLIGLEGFFYHKIYISAACGGSVTRQQRSVWSSKQVPRVLGQYLLSK